MAERLPRERGPLPLTLVVARGRVLVRQGEPCETICIIESGALMATTVTGDGRTLALDVLGPGDTFGGPEGVLSAITVRAMRICRVRPAGNAETSRLLAVRADRALALACDLAWLDVSDRVERRLNDLAERFGRPVPGGIRIAIRLSQEDLAALAGTTRESVNRAVRAMQREGRLETEARGRYLMLGQPVISRSLPGV